MNDTSIRSRVATDGWSTVRDRFVLQGHAKVVRLPHRETSRLGDFNCHKDSHMHMHLVQQRRSHRYSIQPLLLLTGEQLI